MIVIVVIEGTNKRCNVDYNGFFYVVYGMNYILSLSIYKTIFISL